MRKPVDKKLFTNTVKNIIKSMRYILYQNNILKRKFMFIFSITYTKYYKNLKGEAD